MAKEKSFITLIPGFTFDPLAPALFKRSFLERVEVNSISIMQLRNGLKEWSLAT